MPSEGLGSQGPLVPREPGLLLWDAPADGPTNMARDSAMLLTIGPNEVRARLYEWNGPWVTLGRFQSSSGFDLWVRRPTGGRAVYHGQDWTISIAAGLPGLGIGPKQIRAGYRLLTRPILDALTACRANAALAERTTHVTPTGPSQVSCFATTAPLDLVDGTGQKLCGVALRTTESAILLQASLSRKGWDADEFPQAFATSMDHFSREQTCYT
jgi:lipoate-protein ligase A